MKPDNPHRRPDRHIALEGGCNFRDLGGYPTEDGRNVKWGCLFRSGTIGGLTDGDWATLGQFGLGGGSFCDLRTTRERQTQPFRWAADEGLRYYARDYETSFAKLRELMRQPFTEEADAVAAMIAGYERLPFDQAPAYRIMFGHLRNGAFPLVVNCSAGKDRAGMAAALLLGALGASRETILTDYLLTNDLSDLDQRLAQPGDDRSTLGRQTAGIRRAILTARPDYLAAAHDAIEARCGSVAAYLDQQLGMTTEDIAELRDRLLE